MAKRDPIKHAEEKPEQVLSILGLLLFWSWKTRTNREPFWRLDQSQQVREGWCQGGLMKILSFRWFPPELKVSWTAETLISGPLPLNSSFSPSYDMPLGRVLGVDFVLSWWVLSWLMYPSVIIFIRSSITGDMASMSMFNSQKVTLVSDSIRVARCIQMPCHPEALRPLHWGQRGAPQNQLRVSSRIARRWIREIAYFAKYVSNIFTHAR
jgi:hypothetical protein